MRTETFGRVSSMAVALFGVAGLIAVALDCLEGLRYGTELGDSLRLALTHILAFVLTLGVGVAIFMSGKASPEHMRRLVGGLAIMLGGRLWWLFVEWGFRVDEPTTVIALNIVLAGIALLLPFSGLWNLLGRRIPLIDLGLAATNFVFFALTIPNLMLTLAGEGVFASFPGSNADAMTGLGFALVIVANGASLLIRGWPRAPSRLSAGDRAQSPQ